MKVLSFKARNVLGLTEVDVNLEGHNLFLVCGRNGQGKSSTIRSLLMVLCGKSGMDDWPSPVLHKGTDEGYVEVKLSGDEELHEANFFIARMNFTMKRGVPVDGELVITDSAGNPAPSARRMMQSLYKLRGFDPLEFSRMKPKEQRAALCRVLGLDLDSMDQTKAKLYQERTVIGKQGSSKKVLAEAMPYHPEAPSKPVQIAELVARRDAAKESNKAHAEATKTLAKLHSEANELSQEIASLLAQVETKRAELVKTSESIDEQTLTLSQLKLVDIEPIEAEVRDADAINAKVAENAAREAALNEVADLRRQYSSLTEEMDAIEESKKRMLSEAKWPVPGMSVDADGVLLNDLPLSQVSQHERTIVSAKIGILMNPKLRLMVSERGSELDLETRKALDQILKENDFQMIVEVVTNTEEEDQRCQIVIENGREKGKA
jgi:energy-coupling factor transporter ATP-binding protein EcfA2